MLNRILILATLLATGLLKTKDEWKSRTIYQLMTDRFYRSDGSTQGCADLGKYCGGTFKGIESQLDYIAGLGFDAIWISPIPENKGEDYHGYAALNWYKVNPHFGTEQDLIDLVNAAHKRDIWVMVDVVANHVACVFDDFAAVTPFNDASHYHSKCVVQDWNDPYQVEHCRYTECVPDLDQDNQWVRTTLLNWIHDIVQKYGFDGMRVDTVKHVKKPFWKEYAQASGIYSVGEVFDGDVSTCAYWTQDGLDAVLNYPVHFTMVNVFNYGKSMYLLRQVSSDEKAKFADVDSLGNFLDNHDRPRFLHLNNPTHAILKSALTYVLFYTGIPIVYYGTE